MKFELSDKDMEKVRKWEKKQNKICGSSKNLLTYEFTVTGIGNGIEVRHGGTGAVLDLTDVSTW